jgi:hypothetical protein
MGTKKSVIVEQTGGPLGVAINGANVHDTKLLARTIQAIVLERPDPEQLIQNLCLDKAYMTTRPARHLPGSRPRTTHPSHRRGEAQQLEPQDASCAPLGHRAHDRLAAEVPRAANPLRHSCAQDDVRKRR